MTVNWIWPTPGLPLGRLKVVLLRRGGAGGQVAAAGRIVVDVAEASCWPVVVLVIDDQVVERPGRRGCAGVGVIPLDDQALPDCNPLDGTVVRPVTARETALKTPKSSPVIWAPLVGVNGEAPRSRARSGRSRAEGRRRSCRSRADAGEGIVAVGVGRGRSDDWTGAVQKLNGPAREARLAALERPVIVEVVEHVRRLTPQWRSRRSSG